MEQKICAGYKDRQIFNNNKGGEYSPPLPQIHKTNLPSYEVILHACSDVR